jgi:hypothetical protein
MPRSEPAPQGTCSFTASPLLPGVRIDLVEEPPLSFERQALAAGVFIEYRLTIARPIEAVVAETICGSPPRSGLFVLEIIDGHGQRYAMEDLGDCLENTEARALKAGSYTHRIKWTGRNWSGPSCTSEPMGRPFPPGAYQLRLQARGTVAGQRFSLGLVCPLQVR